MSHFITGLICFIAGGAFGVCFMCLFTAGKLADRDIENPDAQ